MAAIITIVFGWAPGWLSGVWALFSNEPLFVVIARQTEALKIAYNVFYYGSAVLALGLLALIWRNTWRVQAPAPVPLEREAKQSASNARPTRSAVIVTLLIGVFCLSAGWWWARSPAESEELKQLRADFQQRAAWQWPALTPEQLTEWATALAPYKAQMNSVEVSWPPGTDATAMFHSLQRLFEQLGKNRDSVHAGNWSDVMIQPKTGEVVINTSKYQPAGPVLVQLFTKAHYHAVLSSENMGDEQVGTGGNRPQMAITIAIGARQ